MDVTNMTPTEKAEELVNKFRNFTDGTDPETDRYSPKANKENAKQCALIACNEVLGYMGADRGYSFWLEVKEEIKKL